MGDLRLVLLLVGFLGYLVECGIIAESYWRAGFDEWATKYGRSYGSQPERAMRFKIWYQNAMRIKEFNAKSDATFTVETNQFSDMTEEEFRSMFLGLSDNDTLSFGDQSDLTVSGPVKYKDWSQLGYVTDVKSQGHCGSCWAFSAVGAMESAKAIATGKLVQLSEQQLVDCETRCHGCSGGAISTAFQYVVDEGGIETELSYPYKAADSLCKSEKTKYFTSIKGYRAIPHGDENQLIQAIMTVGPVSVAIDASLFSFKHYRGGVYQDPECSTTSLHHAVLAVGFGHDKLSGLDYIKVKNSWGTGWGEKGYIRMAANINCCGIASKAKYPLGAV
ncbi:cathepsin L [Pelomyxa schiedti]|nr:cathepsin L [Pelomyxa schiedti]